MRWFYAVLVVVGGIAWSVIAWAQGTAMVVQICGSPPMTFPLGVVMPLTQDQTGVLCVSGGSSGGTNYLLIQNGSRLLIKTGSILLIH